MPFPCSWKLVTVCIGNFFFPLLASLFFFLFFFFFFFLLAQFLLLCALPARSGPHSHGWQINLSLIHITALLRSMEILPSAFSGRIKA